MEVMGDSEDMLGAHRGWASSSGNIVSNDRDKLRLLPEMERVLWKELQWINQREPDMQHMAQQAGIDFWYEQYGEDKDWPEEFKDWFLRTAAWDEMKDYVRGLRALRDARQEGDTTWWQPLRPLLLWCQENNIRLPFLLDTLPSTESKQQKDA